MALARPMPIERRSQPLVEREDALATLRRCLDEEATAVGRIVLIRGEAGIGKTALLKAFVQECPVDVDVFWGACDGVSTPQPYGPFEDMADALGPEFRRLLDANASRGELGRWLLKWLATGPTRVLVVEDVQWADQATLDLLAFLARRIEALPILLLVTHRDGDGDAPSVDRILGGVASLPVLRQLPLEPLSRAGVERLASASGVDAAELHRITAGKTKADGVAFAHELTRMVVLEDVPVIHGIALHRRALAALEQAGIGDAARLAYHAEGSAERIAVQRHAPAAGHQALSMGAHHEAIAQFERALRFADGIEDAARADLLEPLSQALHLISHRPEAYQAAAEAAALRRRVGDHLATAASLSFLAEVSWWAGHASEAWAAARDAITFAESRSDRRELAMAYATLGRLEMLDGRDREGRVHSERALELGRRIGDAEATATALGNIGSIELNLADESGWADLGESARIGRESHFPYLVDRALFNLGFAAFVGRRYELARDYYQQMLEHSERSQLDLCGMQSPIADIEFVLGNWDAAAAYAHVALGAERISSDHRIAALLVLARIGLRRGEPGWQARLDELLAFVRGLEAVAGPVEQKILVAEAEAAWVSGDLAAVVPRLRGAYDTACREGRRAAIGALGIWLWRAGELVKLDVRAEEAYLHEVGGRPREAAAEWKRLSIPYEAAVSLVGSSDPADLDRAYADLTRLGATAVAHKVALRLRELGRPVPRGPRPTTRSNPRGLTEREWEIARLLALGLSNGEIADQLVVSPKTVGHHVSAVLAKLAVRRRAEVAAAISEVGAPI
jgi:DNA-binding CsgD family transcriptional regulator/tetratricopeptide (TPR) repeat protein